MKTLTMILSILVLIPLTGAASWAGSGSTGTTGGGDVTFDARSAIPDQVVVQEIVPAPQTSDVAVKVGSQHCWHVMPFYCPVYATTAEIDLYFNKAEFLNEGSQYQIDGRIVLSNGEYKRVSWAKNGYDSKAGFDSDAWEVGYAGLNEMPRRFWWNGQYIGAKEFKALVSRAKHAVESQLDYRNPESFKGLKTFSRFLDIVAGKFDPDLGIGEQSETNPIYYPGSPTAAEKFLAYVQNQILSQLGKQAAALKRLADQAVDPKTQTCSAKLYGQLLEKLRSWKFASKADLERWMQQDGWPIYSVGMLQSVANARNSVREYVADNTWPYCMQTYSKPPLKYNQGNEQILLGQ